MRRAGRDVHEVARRDPEVQHVRVAELDEALATHRHHERIAFAREEEGLHTLVTGHVDLGIEVGGSRREVAVGAGLVRDREEVRDLAALVVH